MSEETGNVMCMPFFHTKLGREKEGTNFAGFFGRRQGICIIIDGMNAMLTMKEEFFQLILVLYRHLIGVFF